MAEEISLIDNIKIVGSAYEDLVGCLRLLNNKIILCETDYELGKILFNLDVNKRIDWINDRC